MPRRLRPRSRCSLLRTTYAVGELSALNGVGRGRQSDLRFHIVGMQTLAAAERSQNPHHTSATGSSKFRQHFMRKARAVSAVITPDNCVARNGTSSSRRPAKESQPAYHLSCLDYAVATNDESSDPSPGPSPASGPDSPAPRCLAERIERANSVAVLPAFTVRRYGLQKKNAGTRRKVGFLSLQHHDDGQGDLKSRTTVSGMYCRGPPLRPNVLRAVGGGPISSSTPEEFACTTSIQR